MLQSGDVCREEADQEAVGLAAGTVDRVRLVGLLAQPGSQRMGLFRGEPEVAQYGIDADKANYPVYYEEIIQRLRPGGLVVLDNVFLGGRVFDPAYQEEHHVAMRRLNYLIVGDERVESVMLPVRDGVTLARKR